MRIAVCDDCREDALSLENVWQVTRFVCISVQIVYTYANEADMLNVVLFGKTAKQWKDENPTEKGNMRDVTTRNQLLVLANLESYNAVLINQGKNQKERMELLRQLAVQQLQTLETISLNNLSKLEVKQ